jgi:SAM-dependent methyltransferase
LSSLSEGSVAFLSELSHFVRHGARVLELGAGRGGHARFFAALGARVTAVDAVAREVDGVEWLPITVQQWCAKRTRRKYDVVFMRNLLQQLDRDWVLDVLLPKVTDRVRERGIVAIETFFAPPDPPWKGGSPSVYRARELARRLGGRVLTSHERSERGHDISGKPRVFHVARVIVRKPASRR